MYCELCGRENPLNFHHLIPKSQHSKKSVKKRFTQEERSSGINICKHECHPAIHSFITEKDMAKSYYTKELLLNHPKVKKYIKWKTK